MTSLYSEIERVCKEIVYVSEADAPVLAFRGFEARAVTAEIILRQTGESADEPVEEASFDAFFERLTTVKAWFDEAKKERAERFGILQKLLVENLRDRKLFRIGKIRLRILAVGINNEGCVMGVETQAVET